MRKPVKRGPLQSKDNGSRGPGRCFSGQHAFDLNETLLYLPIEGIKVWQDSLQIEPLHLGETLAPTFEAFHQVLGQLMETAPVMANLEDRVAVALRSIQCLFHLGQKLDLLHTQGPSCLHRARTRHQANVALVEPMLDRRQAAAGPFEIRAARARPEKGRYQRVDQDAHTRLFDPRYYDLERTQRLGWTGIHNDHHADEGTHEPEVGARAAHHHVGAETIIQGEAQHQQPAILGEQKGQDQGNRSRHQRAEHPQGAFVQRLTGGVQADHEHCKGSPKRLFPAKLQRDRIGDHDRERGLDGFSRRDG